MSVVAVAVSIVVEQPMTNGPAKVCIVCVLVGSMVDDSTSEVDVVAACVAVLLIARLPLQKEEWDKLNPPTLPIGNIMLTRQRCFMLIIVSYRMVDRDDV